MTPTRITPACSVTLSLHRRAFLRRALLGSAALFTAGGVFAEQLALTPGQTEGPYYPDKLPLDTDNDLLILNDRITPAVGEVTHLQGVVMDRGGQPVRNALVEIWQCDHHGHYLHSRGENRRANEPRDGNFQGYGRFLTDRQGRYYFRTIKPAPYPGRTPHIHCAVSRGSKRVLTTQIYVKDHELNANDGVLRGLKDPATRDLLMADWTPIPESRTGELAASFNLVLGLTPEDPAPAH